MATGTTSDSLADAIAAPGGDSKEEVIPWGASFLVDGLPNAPIELDQYTAKDFVFVGNLSFAGDMGLDEKKYPKITAEMKQKARGLDGSLLGRSDLASVPRFLRWFELPYGRHTPAALIHDGLIFNGKPNEGALGSDIAADRYFRYMLAAVGVPFFKRWIMWAAVALRTRWAVRGWRRLTIVLWVILSALGIAAFALAASAIMSGGAAPGDINEWVLLAGALVAPLLAGALWGKQWGASLVTAVAAPFRLLPAAIAAIGYTIYWVLERLGRAIGLDG
jgi:Protein of unknown function (DUF1353)